MRDTEGGASVRSVWEQAGKLNRYLTAGGLYCGGPKEEKLGLRVLEQADGL